MTIDGTFQFHPCSKPCVWEGYYRRIQRKDSVFHVWSDCGEVPAVELTRGSETARCPAVDSQEARALAKAINSIKMKQTFQERGSFVINEFGQVIVPFVNTDQKVCVGKIEGALAFHNPFESGFFSLNDDEHLNAGDFWDKPYIGMPYIFSPDYGVYYNKDGNKKNKIKPVKQDPELMRKIRSIRGADTARFIVNPYGIALTKKEIEWNVWKPIYIGRINYDKWFEPEC